jgi:hypothetical protein
VFLGLLYLLASRWSFNCDVTPYQRAGDIGLVPYVTSAASWEEISITIMAIEGRVIVDKL